MTTAAEPIWCVMPILAGPEMTEAAIGDLLAQSVPTRLLLINQGVDDAFRERLERLAEQEDERIFVWSHQPPLPSLSATWNRALEFVWRSAELNTTPRAFVVNNDVRLHRQTVQKLDDVMTATKALFVSAVGVTAEQFAEVTQGEYFEPSLEHDPVQKGGPDFSCFLISYECHSRYPFDEGFIPAFCEDLDYHRRLMLDGEGHRIFSVNMPYLHLASQTLKTHPDAEAIRARIERVSRAHYARKWGGPVNQETFRAPYGTGEYSAWLTGALLGKTATDLLTTPELFDYVRARWAAPALTADEIHRATKAALDGRMEQALAERHAAITRQLDEEYEADHAEQDPVIDPRD